MKKQLFTTGRQQKNNRTENCNIKYHKWQKMILLGATSLFAVSIEATK